jgi:hypothetical protein
MVAFLLGDGKRVHTYGANREGLDNQSGIITIASSEQIIIISGEKPLSSLAMP